MICLNSELSIDRYKLMQPNITRLDLPNKYILQVTEMNFEQVFDFIVCKHLQSE